MNWKKFLEKNVKEINDTEWSEACEAADDWCGCYVGEKVKAGFPIELNPAIQYKIPQNETLVDLGYDFTLAICDLNQPKAKEVAQKIDDFIFLSAKKEKTNDNT